MVRRVFEARLFLALLPGAWPAAGLPEVRFLAPPDGARFPAGTAVGPRGNALGFAGDPLDLASGQTDLLGGLELARRRGRPGRARA